MRFKSDDNSMCGHNAQFSFPKSNPLMSVPDFTSNGVTDLLGLPDVFAGIPLLRLLGVVRNAPLSRAEFLDNGGVGLGSRHLDRENEKRRSLVVAQMVVVI